MKTVQKGEDIKRVQDDEAEFYVKTRGYAYAPKSVWKELKKPVKQNDEDVVEEKKTKSKKKKKKNEITT